MLRERGQTEPGIVIFYNIQPGTGTCLFFQSRSPHEADPCKDEGWAGPGDWYIQRPPTGGPSSNYEQRHRHATTKL